MDQEIFTTREAAEVTGLAIPTLNKLRAYGGGPLFCKLGRSVRYRRADLDEWVAARVVSSTSETPAQPACGRCQMTRRYDPRRAKSHLTYTAQELTELFDVAIGTVRKWQKDGLAPIDQVRPFLFAGSDVVCFLEARNKPRQPMPPGHVYCVACKSPVQPLGDWVDMVVRTQTSQDLRGTCPDSFHKVFRRVRISEFSEKLSDLRVWDEDA